MKPLEATGLILICASAILGMLFMLAASAIPAKGFKITQTMEKRLQGITFVNVALLAAIVGIFGAVVGLLFWSDYTGDFTVSPNKLVVLFFLLGTQFRRVGSIATKLFNSEWHFKAEDQRKKKGKAEG